MRKMMPLEQRVCFDYRNNKSEIFDLTQAKACGYQLYNIFKLIFEQPLRPFKKRRIVRDLMDFFKGLKVYKLCVWEYIYVMP